jgi:Concanavalin A-like lectin/glucanases superfamily/Secretion system C-terminal sorting domain
MEETCLMKHLLPFVLLFCLPVLAQIPSYVPVNGLLSYYPFNGNGNDLSPFNNHLTNNGATPTADRFGNANAAYDFNGSNQYLIRNTPSFTFNPSSTFSVSLWHNRVNTASVGIPIMHATTAAGNFIWIYQAGSTSMNFGTNKQQSAWIWASSSTTTNVWTHIVLVYNAGAMSLYKDNILVASATFTHTNVTSTTLPLYVGRGVSGDYFNGKVDDIGIWNRCLSACEINDLYTTTNTLTTVSAGPDLYACNGGAVTLTGTGAQTYVWDPNVANGSTFTPTINQTYTLTGFDANGCSSWYQVAVIAQNVNVNAGQDLFLCSGDSAQLNATGYPGIQWSGGISNNVPFLPTQTQTYIASASNANGCTGSDTVNVIVNSLPQINAGPDQSICFGEEVILYGTGGIFMFWSNNIADSIPFVPQLSGSYVLTGASNEGCIGTDTVFVSVNDASSNTITASALDSYTLNGQTYTSSGTYTQILTNAAGCDSLLTLNLTLDFTGLSDFNNKDFSVYPNPAQNIVFLNVEADLIGSGLMIYDALGRILLETTLQKQETSIDIQEFASGTYLMKVGFQTKRLEVLR